MKKNFGVLLIVSGAVLACIGLYLLRVQPDPQGFWRVLPFVCIGAGCGIFGHGVGDMANRWALRKHPELERQMQIEKDDERNVAISNRAKAKAYDGMLFVLAALMVSFALMGADMAVVLLLVFAYLFIVGEFIYYLNKYQKEM